MSTPKTNSKTNSNTNFDGIHVSKGFVRGLQGQVLRLEQNQQSLIQQLEHANRLATEYHASAVSWQQKYDAALHEKEKTRHALEAEKAEWISNSNQIMGMYERERKLRLSRETELTHLEQLLAEQQQQQQNAISPDHSHHLDHYPCESMSPVSIPSPRKSVAAAAATPVTLSARDREYIDKQLLIEADPTPFDKNNERVVMRDGKRMVQWVEYGFTDTGVYGEREMTMSENEDYEDDSQEYDEGEDEDEGEGSQRLRTIEYWMSIENQCEEID